MDVTLRIMVSSACNGLDLVEVDIDEPVRPSTTSSDPDIYMESCIAKRNSER